MEGKGVWLRGERSSFRDEGLLYRPEGLGADGVRV
jgi:hypothetical protein